MSPWPADHVAFGALVDEVDAAAVGGSRRGPVTLRGVGPSPVLEPVALRS